MSSLTFILKYSGREEIIIGTAERRRAIMKLLCRRRHETISNLAVEFGVSQRTIRRDIDALCLSEPIYTQAGRYGGGVYVLDGYYIDRMYFNNEQTDIFGKLLNTVENNTTDTLSSQEINVLKKLLSDYTKPKV